jgi:hypothetical protein
MSSLHCIKHPLLDLFLPLKIKHFIHIFSCFSTSTLLEQMVCVQDTDQTELEFELQNALLTYPHWRLKGFFNMPQNAVWRNSI